eukprot:gene1590-12715_t
MKKEHFYLSGLLFAVLLNFKHMFLYMAPAYFIFLIKKRISIIKMGLIVTFIFFISFFPFVSSISDLKQILSRLFPFQRGLTHSYWAPNFWAFYNFIDLILIKILKKPNLRSGLTGGIVGLNQGKHLILPLIKPIYTNILCLISFIICIFLKKKNNFLEYIIHSSFTFFMFSFHVHEKAIIMIIIPMSILQYFDKKWKKSFYLLSIVGTWSVFPLLFKKEEYLIKWLILILFILIFNIFELKNEKEYQLNFIEYCFLRLLFIIEIFNLLFLGENSSLPFLHLILTSVHSFLFISYIWIYTLILSFSNE